MNLKEPTEYIQNHINKIRELVDNRQSRIALQTVNEVSKRKSTAKAEGKATSQENENTCGNKILRSYSENLRKLPMNQSRKLLVITKTSN